MVILIILILILIGIILFNPLAPAQNNIDGRGNSSLLKFSIYCFICTGVLYYFILNGNNIDWWQKIVGENSFEKNVVQEEMPTLTQTQPQQQNTKENTLDFDRLKEYATNTVNNIEATNIFPDNISGYGKNDSGEVISIGFRPNSLSDYDGMSKAEIFAKRKKIVDAMNISTEDYYPSERILGSIQDGKPWWGTEGILCKGQGRHASDGMSRESSYFNNPILLLNLGLGRVMNGNKGKEDCANLWPEPSYISVKFAKKYINVGYALHEFMKNFEGSAFYDSVNKTDWFEFGSINARDFGYKYARAYEYKGIKFANEPNVSQGAILQNYWCVGQSCQIEGGCNNICPSNDPFTFYVTEYPAYVYFELYKEIPNENTKPDAYFSVDLL